MDGRSSVREILSHVREDSPHLCGHVAGVCHLPSGDVTDLHFDVWHFKSENCILDIPFYFQEQIHYYSMHILC